MSIKKILCVLLAVLLLAALFAGCKKTEENKKTEEKKTTDPTATETEEEGVFVTMNGFNLKVGVPYADVKDKLGKEIAPAETIDSCDPNSDWKQTMHFYEGVIVTEDKDGNIDGIQVQEGDAALMGKIRIGATKEDVKAVLGEPDTDAEWGIYYESDPMINFYLDEETGLISGFAVMPGSGN